MFDKKTLIIIILGSYIFYIYLPIIRKKTPQYFHFDLRDLTVFGILIINLRSGEYMVGIFESYQFTVKPA